MEVKYQFSIAGLGSIAKSKLYRIVPVDDNPEYSAVEHNEYHDVQIPLVGKLADGTDNDLQYFLSRNIICPLVFKKQQTGGQDLIIPEAIVSVTKKKRIVKTEIVGGTGTIKEFIGDDDLDITITVGIVATDEQGYIIDEYPAKAIKEVQKFLDAKTIDVWSPFLDLFNINGGAFKVVVGDYSITQTTHTNRQIITINAISDYDYTIFTEEQ